MNLWLCWTIVNRKCRKKTIVGGGERPRQSLSGLQLREQVKCRVPGPRPESLIPLFITLQSEDNASRAQGDGREPLLSVRDLRTAFVLRGSRQSCRWRFV